MIANMPRWLKIGALAVLASGIVACAVGPGYGGYDGYDGDVGVGVDVGYAGGFYEPYGYDYGGWGRGYRVGPPRCCDHHPAPHGGRSAPSIPTHPRGRSGGGDSHNRHR